MLTIRADQILVFSEQARRQFEDNMVTHMQAILGEENTMTEPQIRSRVITLIASADSYKIDKEHDVKKYITLFFKYPKDVFEESKIKSILESTDLAASTKIAFLYHEMSKKEVSDV